MLYSIFRPLLRRRRHFSSKASNRIQIFCGCYIFLHWWRINRDPCSNSVQCWLNRFKLTFMFWLRFGTRFMWFSWCKISNGRLYFRLLCCNICMCLRALYFSRWHDFLSPCSCRIVYDTRNNKKVHTSLINVF